VVRGSIVTAGHITEPGCVRAKPGPSRRHHVARSTADGRWAAVICPCRRARTAVDQARFQCGHQSTRCTHGPHRGPGLHPPRVAH
jgi:hypothetical protein